MISDDDILEAIQEARGDSNLAFVKLERKFRATLNTNLQNDDSQGTAAYNSYYIEYMNHTLATASALKITAFQKWKIPSHSRNTTLSDTYNDFTSDVDHFSLQVRLNHAVHRDKYSVSLTGAEKTKIRHLIDRIKRVIQQSPLPTNKRDELFDLLNKFLAEVDRERTRYEVVSDLVIGMSRVAGTSIKELSPIRPWIEMILKAIGKRKEDENKHTLPPTTTRQIEPPKRDEPQAPSSEMDDDIPF
jgi:hypothetical protein